MKLDQDCHLTYCSNIHAGESWSAVFAQLQKHLPSLKENMGLSAHTLFGIGLRLSAQAAEELSNKEKCEVFKQWLDTEGLYVFTLNGFPYGEFHGKPVKEEVYRPDWAQSERLAYTKNLATILAKLLPNGTNGSISTIPGAFKPDISNEAYRATIAHNLILAAQHLHEVYLQTGKTICLALEPEPSCMLETTEETLSFFNGELFSERSIALFAGQTSSSMTEAEALLRTYLTVCLDTCHAAVMLEEPLEMAIRLKENNIKIGKIQLTAALSIDNMTADKFDALSQFSDPVYLHQTSVKQDGKIQFFLDLPDARTYYNETFDSITSWRSHYHVPVFLESIGLFQTTSPSVKDLLAQHRLTPFCEHLEVETYTFDILPTEYRSDNVIDNIARELNWVMEQFNP